MHTASIPTLRRHLDDHVATGTTAQLATVLLALDQSTADQVHRTAAAAVVEELARRHPEVVAALDVWFDDLETSVSLNEAVVAALPLEALR